MASFSLFWTAVGARLAAPPFGLSQRGIAIFALAGAGGAFATSLFGRLGVRGLTRPGLLAADGLLILAVAIAALAGLAPAGSPVVALIALAAGAFLIDIGVTGDQTLGRRAINLLSPEARGRINGLFVGIFFLGGSVGSGIAGIAETWGGWGAVCGGAAAFALAALAINWLDRKA
jgi:predicted MFS family arabinose efflux permease